MKTRLSLIALFVLTPGAWSATWHVAATGEAGGDGSAARPYASVREAVSASRGVPAGEAKTILVHGGDYFEAGVELTSADSGLVLAAAPGESPCLYGGRLISGWERIGPDTVAAALPPRQPGPDDPPAGLTLPDWEIRLLLVNGEPRPRARYPAVGRLPHASRFEVAWMSTTGGGWQRQPTPEELTTLRYEPGLLPDGFDPRNAEITVYHMWDESVVGVAEHDPEQGRLRFSNPAGHPPGAFGVREFVVWNTAEGLTEPGQWYHDRGGNRLVYRLRPGEEPGGLRVVAPTHTTLLRFEGTGERPVREVTVRGLTFSATTVPLVAGGFAAARFDGALSLRHAVDCRLDRITVRGVGGHGINSRGGLRGVTVENSVVTDCGAGGIYLGGETVVIRNNHIHGIGQSYPSAIGVFRGGRDSVVANNEIHDCTYSAINYGGTGNLIASNLLYRCMTELHDGAAIYMFAATNCVLRGNVARDIPDTGGYGSSAYYLDERSSGCVVERNLSVGVARPLHMHMATNNVIRHNVFIVDGDARLTFPRCLGFELEGNVLFATGGIRIENLGAITRWEKNLFHAGNDRFVLTRQERYRETTRLEEPPPQTRTADPEFVDWRQGDFRYRPGSPALRLGLAPIPADRVGRQP